MDKILKEKIKTAHFVYWNAIADYISVTEKLVYEEFEKFCSDKYKEVHLKYLENYLDENDHPEYLCAFHLKEYDFCATYKYTDCNTCCRSLHLLTSYCGCLGGLIEMLDLAVKSNKNIRAWRIAKIIADLAYEME